MVHTIKIFSDVDEDIFKYLEYKFSIKNSKYFNLSQYVARDGVKLEIRQLNNRKSKNKIWRIYIFIDVIKMLDRADIVEADNVIVLENIYDILSDILPNNLLDKLDLRLHRFDYRCDKIIENKEKRRLLVKLYNKNEDRKSYMNKIEVFNNLTKESNKISSLRYQNKSRACNIYDKEVERDAKCEIVMDYEKSIIRYESQIKRQHIKYLKKRYGIDDKLEIYFSNAMYNIFMNKVIVSTVGIEDYYNIYHARKIIKNSLLREKTKSELIELLITTSLKGKCRFKREKCNRLTKKLKELGINPILIPKNENIPHLVNPIKDILKKD